jgi:hypothetical protein
MHCFASRRAKHDAKYAETGWLKHGLIRAGYVSILPGKRIELFVLDFFPKRIRNG